MAAERTKGGREERWCMAQLSAPWAVIARRAGRLLVARERAVYIGNRASLLGRSQECRRIARLLAYGDPL